MSTEIKANLLKLIEDYNRVNSELNEQLRKNGTTFFEAFFEQLFTEHPGLNKVAVLGWTPGFNDGEPCTHSSEVFTGVQRPSWRNDGTFYSDYDDYTEVCEFFTEEEYDEDEGAPAANSENPNLGCADLEAVKSKIQNFEDIIERVYDTNFILKVTRQPDGSIALDVDEYDCGH